MSVYDKNHYNKKKTNTTTTKKKKKKIVQVIQGHMIIILFMKCRILTLFLQLTVKGLVMPHPPSKHTAYIYNKTNVPKFYLQFMAV